MVEQEMPTTECFEVAAQWDPPAHDVIRSTCNATRTKEIKVESTTADAAKVASYPKSLAYGMATKGTGMTRPRRIVRIPDPCNALASIAKDRRTKMVDGPNRSASSLESIRMRSNFSAPKFVKRPIAIRDRGVVVSPTWSKEVITGPGTISAVRPTSRRAIPMRHAASGGNVTIFLVHNCALLCRKHRNLLH